MAQPRGETVVIINPRSAGGKTEGRWPRYRELIHEAYGPFEAVLTSGPGDATRQTRAALQRGASLVVAMGGDGTINEVVNGFFSEDPDAPRSLAPQAAFAVLPAGTGGDFVKSLTLPRDLEQAADALRKSTSRAIDVGRLRYVGSDGRPALRHFINIASFGLSGLVVKLVNDGSKALGGRLSFATATLRAGFQYKNARVRLSLDDRPPLEGKIYLVAVSNGRYFGGGMLIAPDAALDDGQFDVAILGDFHVGELILHGLDIYSGKHLALDKVRVERARRVVAEPVDGTEVLIDLDGEQPGRLPATFELLPSALQVRGA
jgi:YegS/Rv2252/BmrU family lipid kinase